ncbi:MAG TPA: cytochrome d ubiquinol oxidase subunit II [Candidatus Dormibacteraeota bacterium]|nr:cytochrome d ubiquinol oxidase subunit II [Candidatus Dormibacteraeota bacterium]
MSAFLPNLIALVLLLGITAYSTAGGVDFGAGIWDLLAGNSPTGRRARHLIDQSMAPVWEVNNVWLVLSIVVCWTGFPPLFESIFANLYALFAVALVGLILRGAFFAFRHVAEDPRTHRAADLVFGISSILTPFFFAASLGAIASGRLSEPFNLMALAFGAVSVAATAFSGAAFLVGDARRVGDMEMTEYFRRRAVVAAVVLIAAGTAALGMIGLQKPDLLRAMLTGPGLPFALVTMVATPLVAFLLWRRLYRLYRLLTVGAVGSMVFAWAFAQSPFLIPGELTIAQAIAPFATQVLLVAVTVALVVVIGPALALLIYLDQRTKLVE